MCAEHVGTRSFASLRIKESPHGLDIGERVRVKLVSVDVENGFIDFARVHR